MHRNKTFTGIFLIFSIANVTVALAAPALIRQRHFVTERADDEPTGDSKQDPAGLVHEEVEPAATPPPVGSPEKSLTPSELWSEKQMIYYLVNGHLSEDPERTALPSSPLWHQGSSSPEQDPAGLVHEEVGPAATPPPVGSPEKLLTPSGLWSEKQLIDYLVNGHLSGDPERTALPSSPLWHQGSSSPEQDPAGLVHEEVGPAATPPPVGSPEKLLTPSGLWSEKQLIDYLVNGHLSGDPERTALPSSPLWHQGSSSPEQDPAGWAHEEVEPAAMPPNYANYLLNDNGKRPALPSSPYPYGSSPYGSHQGSSLPEQDPAGLVHEEVEPAATSPPVGSPSRPEKSLNPPGWWSNDKVLDYNNYHFWDQSSPESVSGSPESVPISPESAPGSPESLHTASHGQMLPPASVAQPMHESDSKTDMSGWEEEGAKDVEELHPHL